MPHAVALCCSVAMTSPVVHHTVCCVRPPPPSPPHTCTHRHSPAVQLSPTPPPPLFPSTIITHTQTCTPAGLCSMTVPSQSTCPSPLSLLSPGLCEHDAAQQRGCCAGAAARGACHDRRHGVCAGGSPVGGGARQRAEGGGERRAGEEGRRRGAVREWHRAGGSAALERWQQGRWREEVVAMVWRVRG